MDSEQWDERYSTSELIWTGQANQFVEAHLEPGTAIDLGAGEGRDAVWLATCGWAATAVDFSQGGPDRAAQLAAEHGVEIATVCADATAWQPDAPVTSSCCRTSSCRRSSSESCSTMPQHGSTRAARCS